MSELTADFIIEFKKIGITDEKTIQIILNGFNEIAEIGYHIYSKQHKIDKQ